MFIKARTVLLFLLVFVFAPSAFAVINNPLASIQMIEKPGAPKAHSGAVDVDALQNKAQAGIAGAQYQLGLLYFYGGQWVRLDHAHAARLLERAAEQGYEKAIVAIGTLYFLGVGVKRDYDAARQWFAVGSKQGIGPAQTMLGLMYQHGIGTEQNYRKAIHWYKRAASQGNVQAQTNLAIIYGTDEIGQYDKAIEWYWRAAQSGSDIALYRLSQAFAVGIGSVQQRFFVAYVLNRLAWYGKPIMHQVADYAKQRLSDAEIRRADALIKKVAVHGNLADLRSMLHLVD